MIRLALTVKGKILMTVLTVVLMFALFILFYFPARQERYLLENYNDEIGNFVKTVALGVKIALTEQNFEGVETAIDFVRNDERLVYVSLVQIDSVSENNTVIKTVFKTYPENVEVDPEASSSDLFIIKSAPFSSPMMSGEIILSFSTKEIIESRKQIRLTSIIASFIVFIIGLVIGFWLARNISKPVLALRDAANKVGEGDLTQSVDTHSRDEIGELSIAFNKMVKDLNIEATLERVRKQAMAMKKSGDRMLATKSLLNEFDKTISSAISGIGIINEEEELLNVFSQNGNKEGVIDTGSLSYKKDSFLTEIYNSWDSKSSLSYELEGDEFSQFYNLIKSNNFNIPEGLLDEIPSFYKQFCYSVCFPAGVLFILRNTPLEASDLQIMKRFADAYNMALMRYKDLQSAEQSAFEETRQASLNRVRSEIASMRNKDDLDRITPLIWKELIALDVPFIRCGMLIMDEQKATINSYLSSPDGHYLGVFSLPYDVDEISRGLVTNWKKEKIFHQHWNKNQFEKWMSNMLDKGHIQDKSMFQGALTPPESLDMHFVPFKQGMLYVGNSSALSHDKLQLVHDLADSFSIAYARYEDFTKLEEAKNKMEIALSELKSTQTQLIHSEKMASLGELTAGIAHEIQNPLNFVNNFSEVSVDLIEEMIEEMASKNTEEVIAITEDLKQNLNKISHHGKRASSIVKGMLEHSRTGKRRKEFADINVLADEYLRLAYHGLRAKDKTFNSEFTIDLDEDLPKIKIISLDIGRVLLNLINNAFYAVSEKAKNVNNGYIPTVTVSTKRNNNQVEIRVKDNAEGIPPKVLDKIFQPFFTTKPTGQGTGLGLSLSYDIITKGHGGVLKIDTKVGAGTEFIILLPE